MYANKGKLQLQATGVHVEIDDRSEKIGLKIREAETQKIPYMLIIGDKEIESHSLAIRKRKEGNIVVMSIQEIIQPFMNEINENN
ncbi:His/Gly/Thr/Pro-type tRNA ligase C-terminal domain-containing protein [Robertmurraya sp. FSL W8-0741]|uniref:His/Gly/Thr/Pro-type tRNA ligase C-terminal domain-containing protein n=1 Tax=Robertmurraya sp. FSL W8-0741 TaxID=2954629 RepID=UPI0030F9E11D